MAVSTELLEIVDQSFSKKQLEQIHEALIIPVVTANPDLLDLSRELRQYYSSLEGSGNLPKGLYVGLLAGLYAEPLALARFMSTQPESSQRLLTWLVWRGSATALQMYRDWDILPVVNAGEHPDNQPSFYSARQELDTPFLIFPSNVNQVYRFNRLIFHLPFSLRKMLQAQYPKPRDYDLKPAKPVYHTDHVYADNGKILSVLPLIDIYHRQGNIKLTQAGKPQASTLGKMQKSLRIDEYFEQSESGKLFSTLRTHLLASLWLMKERDMSTKEPAEQIRMLLQEFREGTYNSITNLLIHLKGGGRLEEETEASVESRLLDLLPEMPIDSWIDAEQFYTWFLYRGIELRPVSVGDARHSLYFVYQSEEGMSEKMYIEPHLYDDVLLKPFIKGTFFLFAALGLVDVAYDMPDTQAVGTSYFSPFDGLKYVRLTDLGAYIIGIRDSYSLPTSQPVVSVLLSPDALIIRVAGKQEGVLPILENFARRISQTRFKVDYESFLKGCSDASDIEAKIRLFEEQVANTCPENWHAFFSEVRRKSTQLSPVQDTVVFRLQEKDRELAGLIARDEILKGLVIKAEGFHIILQKRNLSRFKNRLKSFGYLL